ncbi:MAG: hypothetical protein FWH48_10775, partial [Oscillospiraceae bacterium]|nr:hypothetical protein [Oscillospiraceae bacterium]
MQKNIKKKAIFIPHTDIGADYNTFVLAARRLCEYGGEFDILHGEPSEHCDGKADKWELVILLGDKEMPWIKNNLPETARLEDPDSYAVVSAGGSPLAITLAGGSPRGALYAAYCLADILKSGDELCNLSILRSPKINLRYAIVTSTIMAGLYFVPGLFFKTLHELPRYGYNGIIVGSGGQGACLVSDHEFPICSDGAGGIKLNKYILPEWEDMISKASEYGMEVILTIAPVVPDFIDEDRADEFYLGGPEPEGYIAALCAYFEKYLGALLEALPGLGGLLIGSTEGIEFGKCRRYYIVPWDICQNPEALSAFHKNNEKIARAYLGVFEKFCGERGLKAIFSTHIAGTPDVTLLEIRRVLYDYPNVTCLEDDYWNNNLWIYDLPVLNYLPQKAREEAARQNFGMVQWCTDAEYYGGASLPNVFFDTLAFSAREAVRLNARMLVQRLNVHDRTPYGTLFGTAEIIPLAASRQAWDGYDRFGDYHIWREWAVRRFGAEAAATVVLALENSKDITMHGFQMNGSYLIMHSAIQIYEWAIGSNCFRLFGRPGTRLVEKKPGEIVFGGEQYLLQMKTASFSIAEFREKNEYALSKTKQSLGLLEGAKSLLAKKDYKILADP